MDIKKYHENGHKGKGIKIAILDSGLGEEYQKFSATNQTMGEKDDKLRSMNIVYIKDFTTPLKPDSSLKVDESVN